MKKRLTAWCITAAMFLSQLVPMSYTAYADNAPVTITSKISGTAASDLNPGDSFYVDVSISPMSSCAFALNASWDTGSLELTDAFAGGSPNSTSFTYVPFYKEGNIKKAEQALVDYQNGRTDDICVFAYASGENLSRGFTVTLEFTVKQGAAKGSSPINVYFDDQNPPKAFDDSYGSSNVRVSNGTSSGNSSKVTAEITNTRDPGTSTGNSSGSGSAPAGAPFTTIIIEGEDTSGTTEKTTKNESFEYEDDMDDDYVDDVSAAAGISDTAGKSIKMFAVASTAILAAVFVFLLTKKQKHRNNGSDRIK